MFYKVSSLYSEVTETLVFKKVKEPNASITLTETLLVGGRTVLISLLPT